MVSLTKCLTFKIPIPWCQFMIFNNKMCLPSFALHALGRKNEVKSLYRLPRDQLSSFMLQN